MIMMSNVNLAKAGTVRPPAPYGPLPTARQLRWHEMEFYGFVHFTVNTFTDKEWGYGDEGESVFNPTDFNAEQIVTPAKQAGMKGLILTAKHHDGFCLWPSKYTEHSVKNSPWKDGQGDVVKEMAEACQKQGLAFGVYLSPWDRNYAEYGRPEYVTYYRRQLRELLTNYGDIFIVWFDGANGGDGFYGGARETRRIEKNYYDWKNTWQLVRDLMPRAVMFSDVGSDVRWVGNESGIAGETCWATINTGDRVPGEPNDNLNSGERPGTHWMAAECDVSIRPGWFYHAAEDEHVKTPAKLLDIYYKSVGRGACLNLNLPPDRRGQIHDNDVKTLKEFRRILDATFAVNSAKQAKITASNVRGGARQFAAAKVCDGKRDTYWATDDNVTTPELVLDLGRLVTFNVVDLREYLPLGQRVEAFALDQWQDGGWQEFAAATSIGNRRLVRTAPITTDKVRLRITQAPVCPAISEVGLYAEPAARVEIDAQDIGGMISPLLFGHNLEHTRRAIWQGLSAQMIANRKFAAVDSGMPKHWWTLTGRGVAVDDQVTYAGKHAVRLENEEGAINGIWQQQDWLSFRKGKKYAFRVWTKSNAEQKLLMRIADRPGFNIIFAGETVAQAGDWQLWSGEFEAPLAAKGARFEIRLGTPGPVWIGAISLMPADNFHGMRRDVVDLFKQLKPGNLRWPGGCFAEYYNWKEGLLPVDQRPPIGPGRWIGLLPDSDGYDNHEIGTDEYIALCRELNAAPMITTRYGEGSPEEARSWVEYCNGAADTTWGKIRAERGHPEPYGVKYWYVGNELWGVSLVKEKDKEPKILTDRSRAFIEAMKKADPSLILTVGFPPNAAWLNLLFAEIGEKLGMVQTGFYFNVGYQESMADVIKTPIQTILPGLKSLRQVLDGLPPEGKRLGIAYYEWNVMWDRAGDAHSGVFAAEMLNLFCREEESLGLAVASYFQPVTEGCIKVEPLTSELEPDGEVFVLYAAHQGNRLLKTPPPTAVSEFDLCASLTPDGKRIYVTVVNRNLAGARTLDLTLNNFAPRKVEAKLLAPLTLEAEGKFAQREEKLKVIDGNRVSITLPPCAVARLCFSISRR